MKKIILLMALVLLAGCSQEPQIIPEKVEEVNTEMEQSRIEFLQQEIANATVECNAIEDEFNATMCFAHKAAKSRSLMLTQNVTYPFDVVKAYCDASNDSDMCFFYVSVRTKNNNYCNLVEEKVGCNLLSDFRYCNSLDNKNECLMNRAYMIQFIDLIEAQRICKGLPEPYHQEKEDDFTCLDIEVPEEQEPYDDRFALTYLLVQMADFEIERVRVRR